MSQCQSPCQSPRGDNTQTTDFPQSDDIIGQSSPVGPAYHFALSEDAASRPSTVVPTLSIVAHSPGATDSLSSFCPGSKVGAVTITCTSLEPPGHTSFPINVDQPVEQMALAESAEQLKSPPEKLSDNVASQPNFDFQPVNPFYDATFDAQPTNPAYDSCLDTQSTDPLYNPRFNIQSMDPLYDPRFNIQSMDPLYDPRFNIQSMDPLYDPRFNIQSMDPLFHVQPVSDLRLTGLSEHVDRLSHMQQETDINIFQKSRPTIYSHSPSRSTVRVPSSPCNDTFLLNSIQLNQTLDCST